MSNKTKEISVFVDESGSFEPDERASRFYLICFVLHDQGVSITHCLDFFDDWLDARGLGRDHCVHVGPLIRREGEYRTLPREVRQAIFSRMVAFIRKADISYHCFVLDKHFNDNAEGVHDVLLQQIVQFLVAHATLFNACERLKVYYDNGQARVKRVLREAFALFSSSVEFVPDVQPERYRLFQAADLLCTVELIASQVAVGHMSESSRKFFGSSRAFKRNVLKQLKSKNI